MLSLISDVKKRTWNEFPPFLEMNTAKLIVVYFLLNTVQLNWIKFRTRFMKEKLIGSREITFFVRIFSGIRRGAGSKLSSHMWLLEVLMLLFYKIKICMEIQRSVSFHSMSVRSEISQIKIWYQKKPLHGFIMGLFCWTSPSRTHRSSLNEKNKQTSNQTGHSGPLKGLQQYIWAIEC